MEINRYFGKYLLAESVCCGVGGFPCLKMTKLLVSWCLGFLVCLVSQFSKMLGFVASQFLDFKVSKFIVAKFLGLSVKKCLVLLT